MTYTQTTLAAEISLSGLGLHTGRTVRMAVRPASADTGIVFVVQGARIPASIAFAQQSAARNTTLRSGDAAVHTVEHVLSALSGLGVDNAEVELDAAEPPAMDGSALPLCQALLRTGIRTLDAVSDYLEIRGPLIEEDPGRAAAAALPFPGFRVTFFLEYDHALVRRQVFDAVLDADAYQHQVAPARTFGFIEEVQALRDAGLALGGSEDNAVVIYPDRFSSPLRLPHELAAHKAADMIGDLALLGRRVRGHFIGLRSGHALNARLVRAALDASQIFRPPA